jgi:hypothetical protein
LVKLVLVIRQELMVYLLEVMVYLERFMVVFLELLIQHRLAHWSLILRHLWLPDQGQ